MAYYGFSLDGSDRLNADKILQQFDGALDTWGPLKGQWKVVWGPAVFALPGTKFDDALMYVVQNILKPDEYVIAIRGTNPISVPNWIIWDFQAKELKAWPYGNPQTDITPMVSESTAFGLIILQGMRPEKGIPGYKQSLIDFFKQEVKHNPALSICVTGHSLGGALAPTLALWLKDVQDEQLSSQIKVSSVAFAGPSPGNSAFAEYFNSRLDQDFTRVANALDIVSYAWETESLRQSFGAYFPPLVPSLPMALLLNQLVNKSKGKDYQQIGESPLILPGEIKLLAIPFLVQAIYQHIQGYVYLLEMEEHIPLDELLPFSNQLKEILGHLIYI
jgi:hypothetical protein